MVNKRFPEAPFLFKTLVAVFFELLKGKYRNEKLTQELVLHNFTALFKSNADVPINVMVEHFVEVQNIKVKDSNQKKGNQVTSSEIQFIFSIANHPKLSDSAIISIVDLFATIYINKPI